MPDYMVQFVTILQRGQPAFSMFDDLPRKYHRALPLLEYHSADTLRAAFEQKVINPALEKAAGGAASDSSGPPSDGRRMIKSASIPVLNRSACI